MDLATSYTCPIPKRSRKWWVYLFFWGLNVTLNNARILYNLQTKKSMNLSDFCHAVATAWLPAVRQPRLPPSAPALPQVAARQTRRPAVVKCQLISVSTGGPGRSSRSPCIWCRVTSGSRTKTSYVCAGCTAVLGHRVWLCRPHFDEFHVNIEANRGTIAPRLTRWSKTDIDVGARSKKTGLGSACPHCGKYAGAHSSSATRPRAARSRARPPAASPATPAGTPPSTEVHYHFNGPMPFPFQLPGMPAAHGVHAAPPPALLSPPTIRRPTTDLNQVNLTQSLTPTPQPGARATTPSSAGGAGAGAGAGAGNGNGPAPTGTSGGFGFLRGFLS